MAETTAYQQVLPLPVSEPREAYRHIRNYLAGRLVGATRDETLVEEVIKCIFCRANLNREGMAAATDAVELGRQYQTAFEQLRGRLPDLFSSGDEMVLDPSSISVIDSHLRSIDFENPARDPIGDAYEAFIGPEIRGSAGQFFTAQNAVKLLVDLVNPQAGERVIDPACGAGGFLSYTARRLVSLGVSRDDLAQCIFGIDKDKYLTHLASAHIGLVTFQPAKVFCADSLSWEGANGAAFPLQDAMGSFDVVLTNPPFGAKIVAASEDVQRKFDLGHAWVAGPGGRLAKTDRLQSSVPPQIFFVERCLALVRPGGRIGMVVPESLVSGKSYRHVIQYIRDFADIRAVIGMPEALFKTSGKGGTHTKTCLLFMEKRKPKARASSRKIFMAETRWCGHDSRGRAIDRDELPLVAKEYRRFEDGSLKGHSHLGYAIPLEDLVDNVLAPRYYDPDTAAELETLRKTHDLVTIGELEKAGLLKITTGDEVGKLVYGSGRIPFVRTSDISNWEIKLDPKHCVSEEVYESLAAKQDVQEGDILMVRDGTYLIGTCAYLTKYDTRIVFQSHIYKLRLQDRAKLSPFLLLAALSSPPVRRQIKSKCFTQDIIDSLGDRLYELVLPLPKDSRVRERVTEMVGRAIEDRVQARELARRACLEVVGLPLERESDVDLT